MCEVDDEDDDSNDVKDERHKLCIRATHKKYTRTK